MGLCTSQFGLAPVLPDASMKKWGGGGIFAGSYGIKMNAIYSRLMHLGFIFQVSETDIPEKVLCYTFIINQFYKVYTLYAHASMYSDKSIMCDEIPHKAIVHLFLPLFSSLIYEVS